MQRCEFQVQEERDEAVHSSKQKIRVVVSPSKAVPQAAAAGGGDSSGSDDELVE
jgi:hypothetical protein